MYISYQLKLQTFWHCSIKLLKWSERGVLFPIIASSNVYSILQQIYVKLTLIHLCGIHFLKASLSTSSYKQRICSLHNVLETERHQSLNSRPLHIITDVERPVALVQTILKMHNISINQSNIYSANIPSEARLSGTTGGKLLSQVRLHTGR